MAQSNTNLLSKIIEALESSGKSIVLSKGDMLCRAGDVEKHLYYIRSGALRAFYQSEFEEHTIRLGYEGNFFNSLSSFLTGKASEFYISALRKTELKSISKAELEQLTLADEESKLQYIRLLEDLFSQQMEREIDLLIESPSERLERVLKRSPELFKHIPLKYIANYLRMTPETLSRIRKY